MSTWFRQPWAWAASNSQWEFEKEGMVNGGQKTKGDLEPMFGIWG